MSGCWASRLCSLAEADVALPVGGLLEHLDAGELLLHALVERLGAVAAVDRVQVALELDDLALAAELLAEELAGLGAVRPVVGAHDHVDVALVGAGVDADHGDLLRRERVEGGGDGAGVLRGHHDGLGALVWNTCTLATSLAMSFCELLSGSALTSVGLDVLLQVLGVGVPEVGVGARQVDADGGLVAARAGRAGVLSRLQAVARARAARAQAAAAVERVRASFMAGFSLARTGRPPSGAGMSGPSEGRVGGSTDERAAEFDRPLYVVGRDSSDVSRTTRTLRRHCRS